MSCGNSPFWVGHHHTVIDAVKSYVPSGVTAHCGVSDGVLNLTSGKIDCADPSAQYNATSVAAAVAIAADADAVILVVGTGGCDEHTHPHARVCPLCIVQPSTNGSCE